MTSTETHGFDSSVGSTHSISHVAPHEINSCYLCHRYALIQFGGDKFPIIERNVAVPFSIYFMVGLASCAQEGVYVVELLHRY